MNAAVIGTGSMGNNHARVYHEIKDTNLAAVCDINTRTGKRVAQEYGTKYYKNHKDLINSENLDLVSICVPTNLHKKIGIDFIEKKIPVLLEKPLAANIKEAKSLISKAKKKNSILLVGHIERFNPAVSKLQDMVNEGILGNILSLVIKRVGLLPKQLNDVSVVQDLAIHDLDIAVALIGKLPYYVYATGGNALLSKRVDHAEIFLNFKKFGCFIQVNWVTPTKVRNLSITGTKGFANLNYTTQTLEFYKSTNYSARPHSYSDFVTKYGEARKKRIAVEKREPLRIELENFVNVVKGVSKPKVTLADGLNAVKLSELTLESIRKRKVIKVLRK